VELALLQGLIELLTGSLWTYPLLPGSVQATRSSRPSPARRPFTAGLVHLRRPTRFAPYIFFAAILWSVYGALLGYLGGRIFEDGPIYALLVAFGIAAVLTVGVEAWRRLRM
jgi:hypothetical protein